MSDRIDELVATVRGGYPWQECPSKSESHVALTELATIAREAEARALKAEADSVEWVDRCYQSDERALKAEARTPDTPNPGSDEAYALGGTCARIDNYYGAGIPYPGGPVFWITEDYPAHAPVGAERRTTSEVVQLEPTEGADRG